jgi:hypothetical protein
MNPLPTDPGDRLPNPQSATRNPQLIDSFGRPHNNLRISVTDRCNLRCTYCMPEEVVFLDKGELLTFEEIEHFVRVAAPLGIDKVRLTGGEPLLRRGLPELVRMLVAVPPSRRGRSMTPGCAGSTSASTRSTPAASACSPAATGWSKCWRASTRRRPPVSSGSR